MKLTKAEFGLLDALQSVDVMPMVWLRASTKAMAGRMRMKGLLSKRYWHRGMVAPTQAGVRQWDAYKKQI